MRLVALCLLLWHDCWEVLSNGRRGMDIEAIADRTSLNHEQVARTIANLEAMKLLRQTADGWELTLEEYRNHALEPHFYRQCIRASDGTGRLFA